MLEVGLKNTILTSVRSQPNFDSRGVTKVDFVTAEQKRVGRVGEQLWTSDPPHAFARAYKQERGDTLRDFCSDLEEIVELIEGTKGSVDRMQHILDGVSQMENNAILRIYEEQFGSIDLWSDLLPVVELVDAEVESDNWICAGCKRPIQEGDHFLDLVVRIGTRMPPDYKPVREMNDTEVTGRLHNPNCAVLWMANKDIITEVFG